MVPIIRTHNFATFVGIATRTHICIVCVSRVWLMYVLFASLNTSAARCSLSLRIHPTLQRVHAPLCSMGDLSFYFSCLLCFPSLPSVSYVRYFSWNFFLQRSDCLLFVLVH